MVFWSHQTDAIKFPLLLTKTMFKGCARIPRLLIQHEQVHQYVPANLFPAYRYPCMIALLILCTSAWQSNMPYYTCVLATLMHCLCVCKP